MINFLTQRTSMCMIINLIKNKDILFLKPVTIELLLINSDLNDSIKENLIRDFCNLKSFKLKNRNLSSSKEYALLNSDFKKQTKFSKDYLDLLYHSKYARHFFTEKHIMNPKKKNGVPNVNF